MADTAETADRHKNAHLMEDMLIGLQSMLNDLGLLSRLQAGVDGLSLVSCNLPDIAARAALTIAQITTERNIKVTIDVPLIKITSDAELLQKVFTGLVLNALHLNSGTEVVFGARRSPVATHVDVDFTGAPVAPERQAEAFIELRPLPVADAIRRAALGLGFLGQLAVALGATITCTPLDGQRQRFSLAFPSGVPVSAKT